MDDLRTRIVRALSVEPLSTKALARRIGAEIYDVAAAVVILASEQELHVDEDGRNVLGKGTSARPGANLRQLRLSAAHTCSDFAVGEDEESVGDVRDAALRWIDEGLAHEIPDPDPSREVA